jgi:hypothetical protein
MTRARWLASLTGSAALLSLILLAGCSGGGSGGGSSGPFNVVDVNVNPFSLAALNQTIVVRFTQEIDPATILTGVLIYETSSNGAVHARGLRQAVGKEFRFFPDLPTRTDFSDAGLLPNTQYTLCVPKEGFVCANRLPPPQPPIQASSGKKLARTFTVEFRTLPAGPNPPFIDPVPGSPFVTRTTPDNGATEIPIGTAQNPTVVSIFVNEPLNPTSLTANSIGLFRLSNGVPVSTSLFVRQSDPNNVWIELRPRTPLPCDEGLEMRWNYGSALIVDLVGNPLTVPSPYPSFRTTANCPPVSAIIENFEDSKWRDANPLLPALIAFRPAEWNAGQSGLLRGSYGFGGDASDGRLDVPVGNIVDLEVAYPNHNGLFNFESVSIRGTLVCTSAVPAVIRSVGDFILEGTIDFTGGNGSNGPMGNTSASVPGGVGKAGAGNGGTANPNPGGLTQPINARGFGPQANIGGGYGGNDSHTATANPQPQRVGCGGGGGSYGGLGINGITDCANAGASGSLRGNFYGDPAVGTLLGGSGGGGGGNAALIATPAVPFPNLVSHAGGSGGSGGGGISIETVGNFNLAGTGKLWMNGGNGGVGGGPMIGKGGDGGGGSGGSIKIQAATVSLTSPGELRGLGGTGTPGQTGGTGGTGRIRLEDLDGSIGGTNLANPTPSVATYAPPGNGRTVAQSLFRDSGLVTPRYLFDGTDPQTGLAIGSTGDLDFDSAPISGQSVKITFQGAPADPGNPNQPDPNTQTWFPPQTNANTPVNWATDISTLTGRQLRFIRFRVEFNIGPVVNNMPLPRRVAINGLQIRYENAP